MTSRPDILWAAPCRARKESQMSSRSTRSAERVKRLQVEAARRERNRRVGDHRDCHRRRGGHRGLLVVARLATGGASNNASALLRRGWPQLTLASRVSRRRRWTRWVRVQP